MAFYKTFDQVKMHYYDAMIITGAPVEHLSFEEVDYWEELKEIMDWSLVHTFSLLYIAGEPRLPFTITSACPNIPCPPNNLVYFLTTSFKRMCSCCAVLMTSSTRRIRATPKCAGQILKPIPSWKYWLESGPGRRVYRRHARRPPDLHHRPLRIRPADPAGRIPARRKSRPAHPGTAELLP